MTWSVSDRMSLKNTIRLATAESTALAINFIPLALWYFEDYSAEATMMIYALECAAAIAFAILFVLIASPAYDPDGSVDTKEGVVSAWTAARRGRRDLRLVLDRGAEAPVPAVDPHGATGLPRGR